MNDHPTAFRTAIYCALVGAYYTGVVNLVDLPTRVDTSQVAAPLYFTAKDTLLKLGIHAPSIPYMGGASSITGSVILGEAIRRTYKGAKSVTGRIWSAVNKNAESGEGADEQLEFEEVRKKLNLSQK